MHTFHAMAFAVDQFLMNFPDIKTEVFFSYLPLCHVAERMLVECGTIFTGSTVYFVESIDSFAANLAHTQPTVFLAVPREPVPPRIVRMGETATRDGGGGPRRAPQPQAQAAGPIAVRPVHHASGLVQAPR